MKFVIIVLIGCVSFVAADSLISRDDFNDWLAEIVTNLGLTCENYKESCPKIDVNMYGPEEVDGMKLVKEGCFNLGKQYLCEGKREGKEFDNVYNQVVELYENVD